MREYTRGVQTGVESIPFSSFFQYPILKEKGVEKQIMIKKTARVIFYFIFFPPHAQYIRLLAWKTNSDCETSAEGHDGSRFRVPAMVDHSRCWRTWEDP